MIPGNDMVIFWILIGSAFLIVVAIVLLIVLLARKRSDNLSVMETKLGAFEKNQEKAERALREEMAKSRVEIAFLAKQGREEQGKSFDTLIQTVEGKLKAIQDDNTAKLEKMRETVDEKLQSTLEKRLGESFKQVSERLEQVYKGLGEMRTLATGVGDLKKVLTNVKSKGVWGEIQLGNILEQILTPEQYDTNVITKKDSNERVEFAIRLPGHGLDKEKVVWLPIDSKFPQEDYQQLVEAQEAADKELADRCMNNLEARIKREAREIKEKYIDPPNTTDFGIMFLPVEGLYAEVLRRPGLSDTLQRDHRIIITGPTTLSALLNSLHMGFRTLAIEKRSSEVWEVLGIIKTEFGKFGDVLAKTKKKLQEASNTIDDAERKTRTIERKLKKVEEVPVGKSAELIEDETEEAD
ncbi:MAG: DNA recombination protein RmuC [Desulfobacterales bacterium]|nr:DNA recombination protein RmuC [Desulfobacterales bacterium]